MGGAAAGTITTAGILGGGSTVGATAFGLVADGRLPEKETKEFLERYREVFRRGPTVEEKDGVEEKDSVAML